MTKTIQKTIEYLNSIAGTDYFPETKTTIAYLENLIEKGYGLSDFKSVIDKKWSQWKGTKYEHYVRPSTLFGSKFENYFHESRNTKNTRIGKLINSVQRAKQHYWQLDKK